MWKVKIHSKATKALKTLPVPAQKAFEQLIFDLQASGPVAGTWPNYGKLGPNRHHCHLKKGNPTYVSVWREMKEDAEKFIEVTYVGTHEKAPY
jgi:mRNA-degrading endonuclease RelE of RelBE toxin-antitoxin system